ncbi:hypothetical protein PRIPAC_91732 [Pristionchus pacificus]|uniref:Uncharacterized protein n=1 Tax=Pristionchus pacificus TaxID=54126 RepID=A0A2A6CIM9_PRIPA|nr:hypothetical protein PRIPAC_91732 [Pristionchus pacificus]|eukprot:PDM77950.1 hypothetical protein PRIPAC_34817 [Pristionchus pacificus]
MAANDGPRSPRNLRSMLFNTIALGAQIQEIEGGEGVPAFFVLLATLYDYRPCEYLIREKNLSKHELSILRNESAAFLNALVANFRPYTAFIFREFPDNIVIVGMRNYRLNLLPVIMKVVNEEDQGRIASTVLYHARIEAYMHKSLRKKSKKEATRPFDYENIDLEKEYSLED